VQPGSAFGAIISYPRIWPET